MGEHTNYDHNDCMHGCVFDDPDCPTLDDLCQCGEDIEHHVGQYLVCPDGIHEYEPRVIAANDTARYAVELDWVNDVPDYDDPDFVNDPDGAIFAARHGVASTVVDPCGPGGGWPIVRFEGTRDAIYSLVTEYDGDNDGESRDYIVRASDCAEPGCDYRGEEIGRDSKCIEHTNDRSND